MKGSSRLLIDESPLQVIPSLATAIGLNEAIVLQQIHYWLGNKNTGVDKEGYHWIYNTYEEWQIQFPFWSVATIKRTITSLRQLGVIKVKQLQEETWDKTNYYRIDYDRLEELSRSNGSICTDGAGQDDTMDKVKMTSSLDESETTPEITTETTELRAAHKDNLDLPSLSDSFSTQTGIFPYKGKEWTQALQDMTKNGVTEEVLRNTIGYMRKEKLNISGPWSCVKIAISQVHDRGKVLDLGIVN